MTFLDFKEMAESAQNLDKLFHLWKQAHAIEENFEKTTIPTIEKNSFIADGYISEDDYKEAPIKVLFVLREANIATHRAKDDAELRTHQDFYGDFLKNIKNDNPPKQKQKIARMAYYLQHPDLSEEERKKPDEEGMKKALASCAYMNINKRGGDKKINWRIFKEYYNTYEKFIKKEISILNPDITVLIGNNDYPAFTNTIKVWHTAYPMPKKDKTGHEICENGNINCYMREFFHRIKEHEKN